jgi:uncharacterized membrane protein
MEEQQNQSAPQAPQADKADVEKNKTMGILAYIIFFIPLLAAKDSKFAMYHANQGLVLFLASVAIYIVGMIIPIIGWFLIIPLGQIAILVFAILGIINASKGEMKPLPLIGGINILK